jgi:hypothetical protein
MKYENFNYRALNKAELRLNSIEYGGIKFGILLGPYLTVISVKYFNKIIPSLKKLFKFFYYLIIPFSKEKIISDKKKKIIFFSSGQSRHLNNLKSCLFDDKKIREKTLFISSKKDINLGEKVFYLSGVIDYIKIFFFLIKNKSKINEAIKFLKISLLFKFFLFLELYMQILRAVSFKRFLKAKIKTTLVGADFSRGYETAVLFSAAKSQNIESFELQHGSFNYPNIRNINADEIWVWGEISKKQLIQSGIISSDRIFLTGSPIIQNMKSSKFKKKKLKVKKSKNVILALSAPFKKDEVKLIKFFSNIKKKFESQNFNFFVKIHPARKIKNYQWVRKYNLDLLPHDISFEKLMDTLDILLTHTSDLAGEAFYFNKKVGILDILDFPPHCNIELHKYFNLPLITKPDDFKNIRNKNISTKKNLLYYKIGIEAKIEIQKKIKKKLKDSLII